MFCFRCGKKVSKKTLVCKKCGSIAVLEDSGEFDNVDRIDANFLEDENTDSDMAVQPGFALNMVKNSASKKKNILVVVVVIIICIVIGVALSLCLTDNESGTDEKKAEEMVEEERAKNGLQGEIEEETTAEVVEKNSKAKGGNVSSKKN